MRGNSDAVPRRRGWCRRAGVTLALAVVAAGAWAPLGASADEPQVASSGASEACTASDANCVPGDAGKSAPAVEAPPVVLSRPSEIARGHEDQSSGALAILALVGFAGLVVSVLHRLSLED